MRILHWLAAFSVVVAIGAGSALAVHDHTTGPANLVGANTVNHTTVGVLVADDVTPANQVHTPHAYSPLPAPVAAGPGAQVPAGGAPYRAPSAPSLVIRSYQQTLINRDRAAAGLRPLSWSSCLASIAAANAARMARQNYMSHSNGAQLDLGCHLGNQAGENIGWWSGGINDAQLNVMFMNSPEHHANIMGPYHYVATAWARAANGTAYIAVEFG
jgi:uncharacterized protein YkwD